ncbi:MAG: hypothetical protein OIF54_05680 [Cohaesibacter sp.]|nr:hypothetical protein [Cohaesibacter sp.]
MSYLLNKNLAAMLIAGMALSSSLLYAAPSQEQAPSRYHFEAIEGGALRMDRQKGTVALCQRKGADWVCNDLKNLQDTQKQQQSLLDEISRLATLNQQQKAAIERQQQQIATLSERISQLEQARQKGQDPTNTAPKKDKERDKAEERDKDDENADLDAFLKRSEEILRHFFGMVKTFKRDLAQDRV